MRYRRKAATEAASLATSSTRMDACSAGTMASRISRLASARLGIAATDPFYVLRLDPENRA